MTPEDCLLDPEVFFESPILLYRLARARYANLSGIGAAVAPGRWNREGQEAIYTSTEIGVPVLERLAHTPKNLIPSNLALMKILVEGIWERDEDGMYDTSTGSSFLFCRSLPVARERYLREGFARAFAIAVPSVIVPAWNVVLYPGAIAFWEHVKLESVEPFEFDTRLFPEEAVIEARE